MLIISKMTAPKRASRTCLSIGHYEALYRFLFSKMSHLSIRYGGDMGRARSRLFAVALLAGGSLLPGTSWAQSALCPSARTKIVGGAPASMVDWPSQATLRLQAQDGRTAAYIC